MSKLKPYRKAILGALAAGLAALGTALADGQVTGEEWTRVAVAAVVTLGAVYAVPNRPAE